MCPVNATLGVEQPRVSILITAWGCASFIGQAIQSALAQTYRNLDVIVSVDADDPDTLASAKTAAAGRATILESRERLGQYANKNKALSAASGELVKFLDGDDVLQPNAVKTLVEAWHKLDRPDIVFGNFNVIDADGSVVGRPGDWGFEGRCRGTSILEALLRDELPGSRFGNVSPHLFQRSALEQIGGFPNDNAGPGDLETLIRLMLAGDVAFVEAQVAQYRVHPSSMSGLTFGKRECEDYARMVERLEDRIRNSVLPRELRTLEFNRRWRVWAGGHVIMACLQRRVRGGDRVFDDLRKLYAERGLEREFRTFVASALLRYALRTLRTKTRRFFGKPDTPPLFETAPFRRALRDLPVSVSG